MLTRLYVRHIRWVVIFLALVGMWISHALMTAYSPASEAALPGEEHEDSLWLALCTAEEGQDSGCTEVITGRFGTVNIPWRRQPQDTEQAPEESEDDRSTWVYYPMPVAQLGLFYYVFMSIWFISTGLPGRSMLGWHLLPVILSILGVASSVFFICVMAFLLETWCVLCLVLHGIDFLICAGVLWLVPPRKQSTESDSEHTSAPGALDRSITPAHALVTLICILAFCAVSVAHRQGQIYTAQAKEQLQQVVKTELTFLEDCMKCMIKEDVITALYHNSPQVSIPPRESAYTFGDPNAPHELVIFTDLQCSGCRAFELNFFRKIWPLWSGQLRYTMRHFPMCLHCNSNVQKAQSHEQACHLAYTLEAAKLQGGNEAWGQMHAKMTTYQSRHKTQTIPPYRLDIMAEETGLNLGQLKRDIQSRLVYQRVQRDIQAATRLQVHSTPTLYLNGRQLDVVMHFKNVTFWTTIIKLLGIPDPPESLQQKR